MIKSNPTRLLCTNCNKNLRTRKGTSKLGFPMYSKFCSPCKKKVYGSKKYALHKKEICERCGFIPEHPCQLDVHHKDHNHFNDEVTNLITLCANCHRLQHLAKK